MILRLTRSRTENVRHVMVLCPEGAFEKIPEKRQEIMGTNKYLCAEIFPAVLADAYALSMESQIVVGLDWMDAEVTMEWDAASRYWFLTI